MENTCDGFHDLVKLQNVDLQLYSKQASPPVFSPNAENLQCQIECLICKPDKGLNAEPKVIIVKICGMEHTFLIEPKGARTKK